jgi:hypothetical protein
LYECRHGDKYRQNTPALLSFLLSSDEQDREGSQGHALKYDCEGHEETDGSPHAAEISIFASAVFVSRKLGTVVI